MNHSSFSDSSNFLDDSSLNDIPSTGLNLESINRLPNQQQELFISTQILEKYPLILDLTIKLLQRCVSHSQLKKLSNEYRQILDQLKRRQMPYHIQDQINQIQQNDDKLIEQIKELAQQRDLNRYKLKQFLKTIKGLYQKQNNPVTTVDQQEKKVIETMIDRLNEQTLSQVRQENENNKSQAQVTNEKIAIKQQQIQKLQTENQLIIKLTQKQTIALQDLKQKIKNCENQRQSVYDQIKVSNGQISLKREILCDLVEKFVQNQSMQKSYDYGINKPIQEYASEISSLTSGNESLKRELQQADMTRAQKSSKLALLRKQLQQLEKQSRQLQSILADQNKDQRLQQLNAKQLRSEQLLLKIYDIQNNRIMNERLQLQEEMKRKQLNGLLELQGMDRTTTKRVVVSKQSENKNQNLFTPKRLVCLGLIVWAVVLVFFFSRSFMTKQDYWPEALVDMPKTVVHRYQGKKRVVDGEVVNITHFEQPSGQQTVVGTGSDDETIRIMDEVIVVEPVIEPHGAIWTERLKMEYS